MHPSEKWNADVRANVQKYGTPVAPQQQGFNPASLLPAIGGTIGAIGGGIIGGPAGAGIGGALGGGAGSALEQAIGGKGVDIGKVGQEAALSGVLGYGPLRALGLVTGTRGLGTAIANRAFGEVAGQGVAPVAPRLPSLTSPAGRAATIQTGIGATTRYNGRNLGTGRATKMLDIVYNKAGVSSIDDATKIFPKVEQFAKQTGKDISNVIKPAKVPSQTFTAEKNTLLSDLTNKFSAVKSVNYKNSELAKNTLKAIRSAKTPDDLWQIKKQISKEAISWTRNPQSMVPGSELFAREAKNSLGATINKLVPDVKPLNADYSNSVDALEIIATASRVPKGISAPVIGRVGPRLQQRAAGVIATTGRQAAPAAGQVAQPFVPSAAQGMTRLEQALRYGGRGRAPIAEGGGFGQKLQNIQTFTALPLSQKVALIRASAPSAIRRQTLAAFMGGVDMGTASPSVTSEQDLIGTTQPVAPAEAVNPYPVENMLYDVSRDPKNANKYISIFNTVQTYIKNQTKSQNLTEAQQARQDIIGMTADAQKLLASGDIKIGFGGLLGKIEKFKGQFNLGDNRTLYFYNLLGNLIGTIARARGGTSFTATERAMMNQYAPTINDSEQQIAQKLLAISDYYTKNPNGGGATGSTVYSPADIQNQVMQGLGG